MKHETDTDIHLKAHEFLKMNENGIGITAAAQYLAMIALNEKVPDNVEGNDVIIFNKQAYDLGLVTNKGIATQSSKDHLPGFFSKDQNKAITDQNELRALELIYEETKDDLLILCNHGKLLYSMVPRYQMAEYDNQGDSLIIRNVKRMEDAATLQEYMRGKKAVTGEVTAAKAEKAEINPAPEAGKNKDNDSKKSIVLTEMERRKKNFKDWGNQRL